MEGGDYSIFFMQGDKVLFQGLGKPFGILAYNGVSDKVAQMVTEALKEYPKV
jgi:hypothetical protein